MFAPMAACSTAKSLVISNTIAKERELKRRSEINGGGTCLLWEKEIVSLCSNV